MSLTEILLFILICYGLTLVAVYGHTFDFIRPKTGFFGKLFSCSMCTGFWVGITLHIISPYTELFTFEGGFLNSVLLGFLSAGTSYALDTLFND